MFRFAIAVLALVLSSVAHADDGALLTRVFQAGFTFPYRSTTCELHEDHVTILRNVGGIQSETRIPFQLIGDLESLVAQARAGQMSGNCQVADVPRTTYSVPADDEHPMLVLKQVCNPAPGKLNTTPSARVLIDVLDANCPSP